MTLTVTDDVSRAATIPPPDTEHADPASANPTATPATAAPEYALPQFEIPLQPELLIQRTVLPYPTTIVAVLPAVMLIDTGLLVYAWPMPTPLTLHPEKKPVLTALLVALLPYPTNMVVLVLPPPPPIDTGLLESAWPMPTPLTLDPEQPLLTAVLVALLPYPRTIVVILPLPPPIDTGQ